jgi:hypothetical protein
MQEMGVRMGASTYRAVSRRRPASEASVLRYSTILQKPFEQGTPLQQMAPFPHC